ncbi:unnamed protein product [Brugia pahangi]|uniref:Uncharacterized protein n=1 Tax=Brugia pahangi TaxID=6280 RepID=A0A0N4TSC3_BRUPA|nr:unnamed protein product [Brugia pahangi]
MLLTAGDTDVKDQKEKKHKIRRIYISPMFITTSAGEEVDMDSAGWRWCRLGWPNSWPPSLTSLCPPHYPHRCLAVTMTDASSVTQRWEQN